jgi:predicted nucleic acid-binding Zn ribbon protein
MRCSTFNIGSVILKVLGSGFWVQGSGFRVQRFRVQGSKVQGSGFKGSGFRVQRFRVQGSKVFRFQVSVSWFKGSEVKSQQKQV